MKPSSYATFSHKSLDLQHSKMILNILCLRFHKQAKSRARNKRPSQSRLSAFRALLAYNSDVGRGSVRVLQCQLVINCLRREKIMKLRLI